MAWQMEVGVSVEKPEGLVVGPGWYRCGPNGEIQKPKPEHEGKDPDSIPEDGWITVGNVPVSVHPVAPFYLQHTHRVNGWGDR